MARIRTVKPELFRHVNLYEAERATGLPLRLCFIGLFGIADRSARFRWDARELKLDVAPYDEALDFARVLDALCEYGFIEQYRGANGKLYGWIPGLLRHQCIGAKEARSRLPAPPGYVEPPPPPPKPVKDKSAKPADHAQEFPGIPGMEKEKEREKEKEGKGINTCTEPADAYSLPAAGYAMPQPFIQLPTNTGKLWAVYAEMVRDWQQLYPGVDVEQALRGMRAWLDANPSRRKTDRGMGAFIVNWLAKDQNRGPCGTSARPGGGAHPAGDHTAEDEAQIARLMAAMRLDAAGSAKEAGHA